MEKDLASTREDKREQIRVSKRNRTIMTTGAGNGQNSKNKLRIKKSRNYNCRRLLAVAELYETSIHAHSTFFSLVCKCLYTVLPTYLSPQTLLKQIIQLNPIILLPLPQLQFILRFQTNA